MLHLASILIFLLLLFKLHVNIRYERFILFNACLLRYFFIISDQNRELFHLLFNFNQIHFNYKWITTNGILIKHSYKNRETQFNFSLNFCEMSANENKLNLKNRRVNNEVVLILIIFNKIYYFHFDLSKYAMYSK